jgi:hypothetical protein
MGVDVSQQIKDITNGNNWTDSARIFIR